jgi:signal transduction histidine kinase
MLLGLTLLALAGLRWGVAHIFSQEIQRVLYVQIRNNVARVAVSIENSIPEAFASTPAGLPLPQWMAMGWDELQRTQPAVKAALLTDPDGSRVYFLEADPLLRDSIDDELAARPSLGGVRVEDLVGAIRKRHPDLELLPPQLVGVNNVPVASLLVLFDPGLSQEMVNAAVQNTAIRIGLMLLVAGTLTGVWLIQRHTTRRLREQRDSARQLAYVGTLAAGLAHEIRNPINALAMQLEMLNEDLGAQADAPSGRRVQRIRDGLEGVERTVSDFLSYAQPGNQRPAMIDLAEHLPRICRDWAEGHSAPESAIDCRVPSGLRAWCDVNALRQVMGNLLGNGWRAQIVSGRTPRLAIEAARDGQTVRIGVGDGGPGVPAEDRPRIFECFFSTHGDGTGLGLPIARRLIEMNEGQLELADGPSSLGGALFTIRLKGRASASD